MSQLEQVRQMCISVVSKHVNAGVMRSVEATTRADTAKLIAAEIAALELPTPSYKQYGYAVLLRSEINEPLPTFDSIWSEYTVAQDHIKEQIQILLDNGENSDECDLVAVPVYIQSEQSTENINSHKPCESLIDTPAAFCIYAENGNVRMWSAMEATVKVLAEKEGLEITPLYKRPMPIQDTEKRYRFLLGWLIERGVITNTRYHNGTWVMRGIYGVDDSGLKGAGISPEQAIDNAIIAHGLGQKSSDEFWKETQAAITQQPAQKPVAKKFCAECASSPAHVCTAQSMSSQADFEKIIAGFERTHCTLDLERRRDGTYARDKTAKIFNTYRSGFYEGHIQTTLDLIKDQVTVGKCSHEKLINMLENFIENLRGNLPVGEQRKDDTSSLPQTIFTTDVIATNRTHGAISKGDE